MKVWTLLLLLCAGPAAAAAETVAVTHATAWTMTSDAPVEDATIIIRDGRVASVAPGGAIPAGARTIDAGGRTVTPALFGAFTQLGLVAVSAAGDTDDRSVASGPLGAAFDVRYALNANDLSVEEARAAGMAHAVVVPTGSASAPFTGRAAMIRLGGGNLLGRGDAAMAVSIGGGKSGTGGSRSAGWQLLRNALNEAKAYGSRRQDGRPRDQLLNRLDIEALGPVVAGKVPLLISAHRESDIREALALARDFTLRIVLAGGSDAWRLAQELAAARVPVILDPLADLPMSYDETGARPDNAAILDRAGVTVAFSVSGQGIYLAYSPAQALREGAGVAVANGMSYAAALRAITQNAAAMWGEARSGVIAPGSDGDLVIWDGDPIEVTTAPHHVLSGGRSVSLVTRQTLLRDRYHPRRAAPQEAPAE